MKEGTAIKTLELLIETIISMSRKIESIERRLDNLETRKRSSTKKEEKK